MNKKGIILSIIVSIIVILAFIIIIFMINNKENNSNKNTSNNNGLISLSYKDLKIKIGEKFNIAATYKDESGFYSHLIYESLNTDIVSIIDGAGTIKGNKSGNTRIKIYAENNPEIYTYCDVFVENEVYEQGKNEQEKPDIVQPENKNEQEKPTNNTIPVQGITLNKNSLSLYVGKSETINAVVTPDNATNKNLLWKSSNSSVATVDNSGKVVGVKQGNAMIIVTAIDGNYTVSIPVNILANVIKDTTIHVNNVTLNKGNLTLLVGQSDNITATVTPNNATNKKVTYSSSNPSIVSIDQNGNIRALAKGESIITVTTVDQEKKARIGVTVEEPVKVSSIKFNDEIITMTTGETRKIDVTIKPSNAKDKTLIWSVNSDIAKVDNNGNVTAIKEGEATIKVQSNDSKESTKPVQNSIKLEILPAKGKITFGDHGEEKKVINCKVGEKQGLIIRAEGWKNDKIATVKSYKSSDKSIVTIASHPNVAIDCINCAYTQIDCKKKGTATITATNSFGGKGTLKVVVK